jgi:phosphoribosyl 1,2-cyclic phosphate phosphodiesterase
MVEAEGHTIIVDTSADFRQQALRLKLKRVDAVLITHCHADHVFGLDDIRPFNFRQGPIPFFANDIAWKGLRQVFGYVFDPNTQRGGALPQLVPHVVMGQFNLFGLDITPIDIIHGRLRVLAYRFGNFAYATDCNVIPDESCEKLRGLDTLIIDGLRYSSHSTHMSIDESLGYIRRLRPKRAFLTHMNHDILHSRTSKELPAGVELAYDGLQFEL